jgi:diguanylate cyclase (GGDEF)-like protein
VTIRNIPTLWRFLGMLGLILGLLLGGTWLTVKTTSDYLLYQSATDRAQNWANFLAENVRDLEQIAAGEKPSAASLAFFDSTRKAGGLFRYIIFNGYGYSVLVSDHEKVTPVELSDFNPDAARSITENRPIVDAKDGRARGEPNYFSEAFVPVMVGERAVAIVAAYVDQTDERNRFYRTFLVAAATLCLLTGLSFGFPAIAWYWRTKEKQQADRRIRFLAHHDVLTGLANRARLIERLESALAVLPSTGGIIAVHFIDIDHFKDVNDTLGHDGGDFLLSSIGQRLNAMSRIEDMVARLGGDEFIVVQTQITDKAQAEAFAQRISTILSAPIYHKGQEICASFTIGVALAPADGVTPERLLKSADLALYSGKAAGRNCIRVFAPEMDEAVHARIALEKAIRAAIANDGFILHYQPIFELASKKLIGFEALVRLLGDDGTLIPPDHFIPMVEELRLMDKLGAWVLREACRTAATWPENLTVAVNLSATQFESGKITETIAEALRNSGLPANRLELEITETLLLNNNELTMAQLKEIKATGSAIVMDDFGTGYSSLRNLWKFPFDKLKIDRSFMQGIDDSGSDVETVVKTIMALGRQLHMRVTIEGVETATQVNFLSRADADQVQGFFFGRPVPASEISANILSDFNRTLRLPQPAKCPRSRNVVPGLRGAARTSL